MAWPSSSIPGPLVRSRGTSVTRSPPSARVSSSRSSSAPCVRPTAITWAPATLRARAAARPMPRVAPVTSATRPAKGSLWGCACVIAPASSVDQERKLPIDRFAETLGHLAVEQARGVVAGEVVVGELRAGGVAGAGVHRPVEALDREIAHGVDAEDLGDLVDGMVGGQQLLAV